MSKELEETTQSKISFFTGVSHDLRTPLTLILAPVEQLQGAKNLTEEQQGLLRVVQANADILLRLVAQTLDFRKFENGQLRLNLQRYTLREAIHQWCAPFATLARQRIVRFHLNMDALPTEGETSQGWLDAQRWKASSTTSCPMHSSLLLREATSALRLAFPLILTTNLNSSS